MSPAVKVFVAGATGALGRPLVSRLVERGHQVAGMTPSGSKRDLLRELGAEPVLADALAADGVARAVAEAEPEVIVHQLTAIGAFNPRRMERDFAPTNRLRTEGTDHLLAAGRAVGVKRFVAQSFAPWVYARTGGQVKTEDDPLDSSPPAQVRTTLEAIKYLERAVTGADWTEGIALRYGGFYGPGTSIGLNPLGEQIELIRARKFPLAGKGTAVWSFIHIEDAASATSEAVEHGRRGIYNIVDDEPAPIAEWLPELAKAVGAKPPRRVPLWLARLAGGELAAIMMSDLRGQSNTKAKRELGWRLRWPTWREGFAEVLDRRPRRPARCPCLAAAERGAREVAHPGRQASGAGDQAALLRGPGGQRRSASPGSPAANRAKRPFARLSLRASKPRTALQPSSGAPSAGSGRVSSRRRRASPGDARCPGR